MFLSKKLSMLLFGIHSSMNGVSPDKGRIITFLYGDKDDAFKWRSDDGILMTMLDKITTLEKRIKELEELQKKAEHLEALIASCKK